MNGRPASAGRLGAALQAAIIEEGCSLKALTVLAPQNDPFRVDTPSRHRDGEWLAVNAEKLPADRKIHLRGLHYMLIGEPKPDGKPYTNTDEDWQWLSKAGKAARWLGHVPFERIVDARNTPPTVRMFEEPDPEVYISVGNVEVSVPDVLVPRVDVEDFVGAQPYKLVLFGEKTSLEDVLAPIAEARKADLYLPTGEASDTMIHQMAKIGAIDGRRMVVFYLSDCDPSGWQMAISVARKLQALKVLAFPTLDFEVRPIALTPDQVHEYGLPSTPMKATEKRADKWTRAMGVQQTEIDALATLQPDLLTKIVRTAIKPFYDTSLDRRVREAREEWAVEAQSMLKQQLGPDTLLRLRAEARAKLAGLQVDEINDALRVDVDDIDLPEPVIPEPEAGDPDGVYEPLIDSDWGYAEQARRLIAHKANEEAS